MIRFLSAAMLMTFMIGSANADTYSLDPTHTYVLFSVQHKGLAPNWGRFNRTKGAIELNTDVSKNSISIEIDAASVDTGHPKRDAHLRNADFFDAGQFPKILFKSTAWKAIDANTFEVSGEITFHGVTKPLTVTLKKTGEGTDRKGRHKIGYTTEFQLDRFAHGVTYGAKGIGQMVRVMVSTETTKKSP
mgnify:CR=1 FL=1